MKHLSKGKCATYQVIIQNVLTALLGTGEDISVISERFFRSLPQTPQLLKDCMHKVTSAVGVNLGPIDQCDLTFSLGNKQFTTRFIILLDLHRNIILGLNWHCNFRIGCNWNINAKQYNTHTNNFLCPSIPLPILNQ